LSRRQRQAGMALLRGNTPRDATVALLKRVAQLRFLSRLPPAPCQAHPFTRNVIERNIGRIATLDGS
jgi:hypothetical protein